MNRSSRMTVARELSDRLDWPGWLNPRRSELPMVLLACAVLIGVGSGAIRPGAPTPDPKHARLPNNAVIVRQGPTFVQGSGSGAATVADFTTRAG